MRPFVQLPVNFSHAFGSPESWWLISGLIFLLLLGIAWMISTHSEQSAQQKAEQEQIEELVCQGCGETLDNLGPCPVCGYEEPRLSLSEL